MREAPDGLCPSGAFIASRYGGAAGVPTARYGKTALAFAKAVFGGDKGDRTPDLMTASHALSQLSYTPKWNYYRYEVLKSADCAKNRETFVGA